MYEWEDGMGEISGFGGGYEAACRAMVKAGCEFLDSRPDLSPSFQESPQIFGVTLPDDQMKLVEEVMLAASGGDCTGAMMHACSRAVLAIKAKGWDWYKGKMSEKKA